MYDEIRTFVLERYARRLAVRGLRIEEVPDDFDLVSEGVVDSMGLLELVMALEERFGVYLDLDDHDDPDELGKVGVLCRVVARKAGSVQ